MTEYWLAIVAVGILVLINLYASYRCIKSDYSDYPQRYYQLVVVWLIPIIGAVTIIYFSRDIDTGPNYKTPDENDSLGGGTQPLSDAGGD